MNGKILRLGLVGKDVSKSISPPVHTFILNRFGFDCIFEKFSVGADEFDFTMRRLLGDFDGFNVTIPYKRDVMEYLDEVLDDAFDFGAVNTVVTKSKSGYNTDGLGFMLMLKNAGVETAGKKVLVIGGGGAGRSTAAVLKRAGANVFMYRRNQAELKEVCAQLGVTAVETPYGKYDVLINATGVGMHDSEGKSPVESRAFNGATTAVDLIYHPLESEFLRLAKARGLQTVNGEAMLFYQAYYADCLYLGISPDDKQAKAFFEAFQKENEKNK